MRVLLFLALLGPIVFPVAFKGSCGCLIDEVESCMEICRAKLGKRPFMVEVLGRTGKDQWRTCACYTARTIVIDDLPPPVEKESK